MLLAVVVGHTTHSLVETEVSEVEVPAAGPAHLMVVLVVEITAIMRQITPTRNLEVTQAPRLEAAVAVAHGAVQRVELAVQE